MSEITTVFFDLGDTLGTPVLSAPPSVHVVGFNVFAAAWPVLADLNCRGLRLGIISNTGVDKRQVLDAVLAAIPVPEAIPVPDPAIRALVDFFESPLRIYSADVGHRKDSRVIFDLAAAAAGVAASACLFVGEDAQERSFATEAGMHTAPDLKAIEPVLTG